MHAQNTDEQHFEKLIVGFIEDKKEKVGQTLITDLPISNSSLLYMLFKQISSFILTGMQH